MLIPVKYAHSSGLDLAVISVAGYGTGSLWAGYNCGSRHDPPGMGGMAHLLEHLCTRLVSPVYERLGVHFNAHTYLDFTSYSASFLPQYLESALETERLRMMIPSWSAEGVYREVNEVSAEIRIITCRPEWQLSSHVVRACLGTHPYSRPVLGDCEELRRLTVPQITAHWCQWYKPRHLTLVVVGDGMDLPHVADKVERIFSCVPQLTQSQDDSTELEQSAEVRREVFHEYGSVPKPIFHYAYRVCREDIECLPLIQMLVSGTNPWSRHTWGGGPWFFRRLERDGMILAGEADYLPTREPGVFHLIGRAANLAVRDALETQLESIGSAVSTLVTCASVKVIGRQLTADILRMCSSPVGIAHFIGNSACTGLPNPEELIRGFGNIRPSSLRHVAARLFRPGNCVAGWILGDD